MTAPCPVICLTDITDPGEARIFTTVRTLADDQGNRYVLLSTAQYVRLLARSRYPESALAADRQARAAETRMPVPGTWRAR